MLAHEIILYAVGVTHTTVSSVKCSMRKRGSLSRLCALLSLLFAGLVPVPSKKQLTSPLRGMLSSELYCVQCSYSVTLSSPHFLSPCFVLSHLPHPHSLYLRFLTLCSLCLVFPLSLTLSFSSFSSFGVSLQSLFSLSFKQCMHTCIVIVAVQKPLKYELFESISLTLPQYKVCS